MYSQKFASVKSRTTPIFYNKTCGKPQYSNRTLYICHMTAMKNIVLLKYNLPNQ